MDKDASQTLAPAPSPVALDAADLRIGGYVSIVMFAAGATLLPAIALPIRDMSSRSPWWRPAPCRSGVGQCSPC